MVNDRMQNRYVYYLTEPMGKHFDPAFTPGLSPKEMLSLGVFGGHYWDEIPKEFPQDWFANMNWSEQGKNPSFNFFKVAASQPLRVWQQKGWIHPDDPHGWFQWYCRYFYGRRHIDDARQIKRWKAMQRHVAQVKKHCKKGDFSCRPKQRQALLHWAIDSRKL